MWGHYLLTLYRSLTRHRLYAALNVLGLAVGIAVFLVLTLQVRFETSFDRWLPQADQIYRITSTYAWPGRAAESTAQTSGAVLPPFRMDFPQALASVRLVDSRRPVQGGTLLDTEQTDYVDPSFFDVLQLPLISGDRRKALSDPNGLVITERIAKKYFGGAPVIGKKLTLFYHGVPAVHEVTGLLKDLPANSHLRLSVLAPLTPAMANDPENGLRSWGAVIAYTYVKFSNRSEAAAVQSALPGFVKRHAHDPYPATIDVADFLKLRLTPVTDIHFADAKNSLAMKPGADVRLVFALGLIGVLTLLLAVANYINLATARSSLRAKEVALRKVMGATRLAIGLQMLAESIMFAIVATLIGVALAELALPVVNALGGTELHLTYWGPQSSLPYLAGVAIAVGAAAGVYPALLLSRFEPAPVLAASRSPGGGKLEARIRVVLISAQFVVAIVITICTLVIGAQARFIHTQDRGFRRDGLIVLDNVAAVLLAQRQTQLLDSFRRTPGVVSATATLRVPGLADGEGLTAVHRPGAKGPPVAIGDDIIADNFLKTMGTRLAAGRMFDQAHGLDDIKGPFGEGADNAAARGLNVVINQTAARALGFSSPSQAIGKQIFVGAGPGKTSTIIGVIQDIQLGSPLHPVTGVIYWYDSKGDGGAVGIVRYAGVDSAVMIARLRSLWSREAASVPFIGETAEDLLSGFYVPDAQRARIFSIGSTLALAIACVGLYGLASFNTARRTKEIGIRKTLGASTGDILKLLIGQFLAPVLVANLIAWPLAYVAMRSWLSGFDQRIALSPLYFVVATLLALLIATLTVAGQAWRVARSEPAKALRHE